MVNVLIPTYFSKIKKYNKLLKVGNKYFGYTKKIYYSKNFNYYKEMC
jgi:hypothetical protein